MNLHRPSGSSPGPYATSSRSIMTGSTHNATSDAIRPSENAHSTMADNPYDTAPSTAAPGRPVIRASAR